MRAPAKLAFLGEALDMVLEVGDRRDTIEWRRPHWLCADETLERLWILPAPRARGRRVEPGEAPEMAHIVRLWSQFEPTMFSELTYQSGPSKRRGDCVSIAYRSSKWTGKMQDYEHAFDEPARVVQAGELYRLAGPTLKVTARGIQG